MWCGFSVYEFACDFGVGCIATDFLGILFCGCCYGSSW